MHPNSHSELLHGAFFVLGLLVHIGARYLDFRRDRPGAGFASYRRVLARRTFVTAKVLSLLVLAIWLSDYPVGGFRFSAFLPHTNLVAFILGYLSDSITKYLTKRIPFLKVNS